MPIFKACGFLFLNQSRKSRGVYGNGRSGSEEEDCTRNKKGWRGPDRLRSVSPWREHHEPKPEYCPDTIWGKGQTVIVLGIPMSCRFVESTPSINHTGKISPSRAAQILISFCCDRSTEPNLTEKDVELVPLQHSDGRNDQASDSARCFAGVHCGAA